MLYPNSCYKYARYLPKAGILINMNSHPYTASGQTTSPYQDPFAIQTLFPMGIPEHFKENPMHPKSINNLEPNAPMHRGKFANKENLLDISGHPTS